MFDMPRLDYDGELKLEKKWKENIELNASRNALLSIVILILFFMQ